VVIIVTIIGVVVANNTVLVDNNWARVLWVYLSDDVHDDDALHGCSKKKNWRRAVNDEVMNVNEVVVLLVPRLLLQRRLAVSSPRPHSLVLHCNSSAALAIELGSRHPENMDTTNTIGNNLDLNRHLASDLSCKSSHRATSS
jgi:hypothetical protein